MTPTDPQPVPDDYRCGGLNDDEWEVLDGLGEWSKPSLSYKSAILVARRKQAPPLTPREGDTVEHDTMQLTGQVVYTSGDEAAVGTNFGLVVWSVAHLTVTDRPPRRPVRVWLTDEQVQSDPTDPEDWAWADAVDALVGACRALVDGEG